MYIIQIIPKNAGRRIQKSLSAINYIVINIALFLFASFSVFLRSNAIFAKRRWNSKVNSQMYRNSIATLEKQENDKKSNFRSGIKINVAA